MKKGLFILVVLLFGNAIIAQTKVLHRFRVVCYNVENLFDCVDDSLTNDSEYLPGGIRGWTYEKYRQKQTNIGKVIVNIGGWDTPAIVGLCEIESRKCLIDLTRYSGMKNMKYEFVHFDSKDARGVDVALLYQPDKFMPIVEQPIPVIFPFAPQSTTRDILYVQGTVPTGDTLHVFVCHFPSRLGGELESEDRRNVVASTLRNKIDSVFVEYSEPAIIVMGDFNDYPTNRSMFEILGAQSPTETEISDNMLYNLMLPLHKAGKGSHKHEGEWGALDQIIVSGRLFNTSKKFYTTTADVHIFDADFLLERDEKFLGKQPKRTYVGMKYNDGFSDHLPVYLDIWW